MIARSVARSLAQSAARPMSGRVFAVAPTERVSNGNFAAGNAGWTEGTGWLVGAGAATNLLVAQNLTSTLIKPTSAGLTGTVAFTVASDPGGSQLLIRLRATVGGATQVLFFNFPDLGANGPFAIAPNDTYDLIDIRTSSAAGIVIDNISVIC